MTRFLTRMFLTALPIPLGAMAQVNEDSNPPPKHWKTETQTRLLLTQTAFSHWNAGGDNSISGILSLHAKAEYQKGKLFWNNHFNATYGLNKREGESFQKTDDVLNFESKFGYRKDELSKWYYSGRFSFNTQFDDGFRYHRKDNKVTRTMISRFLAPGYLLLGIGADFNSSDKKFKVHLSPITNKTTFVFDEDLSNAGAFGVKKGENTRLEFGVLSTLFYQQKLMKNVEMINKLTLYSDYFSNYGKLDINWDCQVKMFVNKYIESTFSLFLLFDEDIKDKDTGQAEIQIKQILGVGFTYTI